MRPHNRARDRRLAKVLTPPPPTPRTDPLPDGVISVPLTALLSLLTIVTKRTGTKVARVRVTSDAVVFWRGPRKGGFLAGIDTEGTPLSEAQVLSTIDQIHDRPYDMEVHARVLSCCRCQSSERVTMHIDPDRGYLTMADDSRRPVWSFTTYPDNGRTRDSAHMVARLAGWSSDDRGAVA